MSTSALSLLIRSQPKGECYGGFIFTASYNPGGPNNDMGIKYNEVFDASKVITKYLILDTTETFPMDKPSEVKVDDNGNVRTVKIEIESTTKRYVRNAKII